MCAATVDFWKPSAARAFNCCKSVLPEKKYVNHWSIEMKISFPSKLPIPCRIPYFLRSTIPRQQHKYSADEAEILLLRNKYFILVKYWMLERVLQNWVFILSLFSFLPFSNLLTCTIHVYGSTISCNIKSL